MNLCLSGLAGCFPGTEYPKVVDEAVAHIKQTRPDVGRDQRGMLRRRRPRSRSARACTSASRGSSTAARNFPAPTPTGRGFFGNAVLTRDAHVQVESQPYRLAQLGKEQRRWICVTSGPDHLTVCGTHLALGGAVGSADRANQDAQCAEFGQVLQARTAGQQGDRLRRHEPADERAHRQDSGHCATTTPRRTRASSTSTERATAFTSPAKRILPATYTDHDHFLVTAKVQPGR